MISKSYLIITLILFSCSMPALAHHTGDDQFVHVCGDAIDWPPYTYLEGDDVKGRDIDILNKLLPEQGLNFDMTMTSWTRCLKGTAEGEFQIAVSASYHPQRAEHYLYTEWYYQITPYFIYSTQRFPDGLSISKVEELEQYRVCGIHGYNYSDFKLSNIKQKTINMYESVNELKQQNCDILLSWREILDGIEAVWGIVHVSDDIVAKPVPNMEKHKFYMLISKQLTNSEELQSLVSEGLVKYREVIH